MSIWIFDRHTQKIALCAFLLLGLTACSPNRLGGVNRAAPQKTTVNLSSKQLVIQGPPGFCVDEDITEIHGDNAFLLLGNCAVVSPSFRAVQPNVKALLTASISSSGNGQASIRDSAAGMDSFFRSETGRTALSRNSDPGTVQVLDTFHKDNTFFIRATDTSEGLVPGASDDYWRAYFDLDRQIVSVSVIGFQTEPLAPETGLKTVREFANAIKSSNGVVTAPLPVQQTTTTTPRRPIPANTTLMSIGFLRRIFGI